MKNKHLKNILKQYEEKRFLAELELDSRKKLLYSQNKRLAEIESELSTSAINVAKLILTSNTDALNDFISLKSTLQEERTQILKSIGKDADFLTLSFSCSSCNDTGYIESSSGSEFCSCLKQELFNIEINKYNMNSLSKENFDNFNLDFYSNTVAPEKYSSEISPRENITHIKKVAKNFIYNIDNPEEKNLLFKGTAGLGKTFLCNCIANELIKQKRTILYQTAPILLDEIISYRLNKPDANPNIINNTLNADLLIIDDLGTENINNMQFTELFNIINTRLLNRHSKISKTIISTNLSLKDIYTKYGERIGSRIVEHYNICTFFGEDIRFKKI